MPTGWHEVGSLRLASAPERMEAACSGKRAWARTFGLPLELISADEAGGLFPPMTTDGVLGAAFLPTDGYIDPSQLTFALIEGAKRRWGRRFARTRASPGVEAERGRVRAVLAGRRNGSARTPSWNAGGILRGGQIGRMSPASTVADRYRCGARVPHHEAERGRRSTIPTMRDPSLLVLLPSGRRRGSSPAATNAHRPRGRWNGIPADSQRQAAGGGLRDRFAPLMEERGRPCAHALEHQGGREARQRSGGVHAGR